MTPRENLLQTLRCENPQWIPTSAYLFPNENPTSGVPEKLKDVFNSSSGSLAHDILKLGEYWGAEDFKLPVPSPATFVSDTCSIKTEEIGKNKFISTMSTPKGELRQITEKPEGHPSLVTERYVKTIDDAIKLIEYFSSLRIEITPDNVRKIKDLQKLLGDRGILFFRTFGTPLGMCYRVYSDIVNLVYMIADAPVIMGDLFACMEEKYFQFYEFVLREVPEIDAFFGMDDTSTTLISPDMFNTFNVELLNKRADLCHAHGKIYMHHSCGLIHDLLPVYRKTRMDGVDAFTVPPIGNVGYIEGRKLLGPRYSMNSSLTSGMHSMDKDAIKIHLANRFKEAGTAGNVALGVGGAHLTFSEMEFIFTEAQKFKPVKQL
ncbi:MAG: hypothetical protein A2017_03065 [Lentisphaerae bacterium GWF2_44_16]|nr:MAG: hypothetical protein A2017_03065 [Lentisphaerae bacterium GWF2_44_16]